MRFHVTLEKAISFIKHLYGGSVAPGGGVTYFQLALKTAGLTEDIQCQDYLDYHLTWLTGVLCDALEFNEEAYRSEVENILSELQDVEGRRVQQYVEQLTYNRKLQRGQQYKNMLDRVADMDSIVCYIMIFRLYQICIGMRARKNQITKDQYQGFLAYAYLFWYRAISKHMAIGKNTKDYIKQFFKQVDAQLGGMSQARKKSEKLFKSA